MERRHEAELSFEPAVRIDWLVETVAQKAVSDLARETTRCLRNGVSVAVIAIRLQGEAAADSINPDRPKIRTVQRQVADCLRHTDTISRLNDRELIAILPGADYEGGRSAAQRLQRISATQRKKGRGFSYDLGVAAVAEQEESPQDLIERARAAYGAALEA